jgi:hypothetical protein
MKTNTVPLQSTISSAALSSAPAPAPCPVAPSEQPGPGRPTYLNERVVDELCSVIRETGVSDSGAAARMHLHPSTVSRWKREHPDLGILLRSAREEFRMAQLGVIMDEARAGRATSWRAAAWLLERIFPEDYAPRAKERAQFQERFDAICAAEAEGGAVALPTRGEPLQNVKNSPPVPPPSDPPARAAGPAPAPVPEVTLDLTATPLRDAIDFRLPETPLQNVKNSPLAGPLCPPTLSTRTVAL